MLLDPQALFSFFVVVDCTTNFIIIYELEKMMLTLVITDLAKTQFNTSVKVTLGQL